MFILLKLYLICINFVGLPWQRAMTNNLQKTSVSKNNVLQRLFTYYFNYVSNNSNKKKGIRARNKLFPHCLCSYSLKAGSHIIAANVSIAAVNSKSGLTIGTII